jgi:D-lactate dehydrogenase (cytochrome)
MVATLTRAMTTVTIPLLAPEHLAPRGDGVGAKALEVITDPEELETIKRDAAAMEGTGASGLVVPTDEGQLARWLRDHPDTPVLVQGALTSLTGGATPDGDVVISLKRMTRLELHPTRDQVTVGAGLVLANLQEQLADEGLYYPPAPTHDGASIGGNVATNAAGAATFKYGTTRDWVERLRLVLRHGEVLELRRGEHRLEAGDVLRLVGRTTIEVPLPRYLSPTIKKSSAGYFVRTPMDAIDLIIGSEGTLGIITEIDLQVIPRPRIVTGLVVVDELDRAVELVGALRTGSLRTCEQGGKGMDVRSIELFDRRCLELLRAEDKLGDLPLDIPPEAQACLLFEQEVGQDLTQAELLDRLGDALEGRPHSGDPIGELVTVLSDFDLVERSELALPGQERRQQQLAGVRESIPLTISDWLLRHNKTDPLVHKVAGDMIVPFEHFGEMMTHYYETFRRHGVDVAVFGHISDGNVHPNGLPRDGDELHRAKAALLELADTAKRLGGCPLSEQGVGKHPLKTEMVRRFWGEAALAEMRAVKRAFDPGWTLGRGVYFDPEPRA